jgi:hypothetical protein
MSKGQSEHRDEDSARHRARRPTHPAIFKTANRHSLKLTLLSLSWVFEHPASMVGTRAPTVT